MADSSSRSAVRMFGATNIRRGLPCGARSYCPSTLVEIQDSRPATSVPVTLAEIACEVAPSSGSSRPERCARARSAARFLATTSSSTGASMASIEAQLARIHPARSTTRASGVPGGVDS